MKRILLYVLALLVSLCACGQVPAEETSGVSNEESTPTWQEQYDLGVRYLSEGNYKEAIIAFTAAIEIDPKQAQAYVSRGDAYIGSGETEENLSAAQMDYENAIELDETDASAWLGLADVYIRQGNYDRAEEVLRQAFEKTGTDQCIADKLAEFASEKITDSQRRERKTIWRLPDDSVESYSITNYDNQNRRIKELYYQADGTLEHYNVITYRDNGFMKESYDADGNYLYSEDHIDLKGDSEFYSRVDSYDSTVHWSNMLFMVTTRQSITTLMEPFWAMKCMNITRRGKEQNGCAMIGTEICMDTTLLSMTQMGTGPDIHTMMRMEKN